MNEIFFWILGFTFLGSVGSLLIASFVFAFSKNVQAKILPALVAYATGALLGTAFLGLIPEAFDFFLAFKHSPPEAMHVTALVVLIGIFVFFILEKLVLIHHCHDSECSSHHKSTATMIFIGDSLHNFVDGVLIASSFMISVPIGIATSVGIIIHEIAHETGDIAILLHRGYEESKALWLNFWSSVTAFAGAILGYFVLSRAENLVPYVMAFAAASFIYIALSDLFPELHKKADWHRSAQQLIFMILGALTVGWILQFH